MDSPMVGRSRQLRQLDEAFRTIADERACYLFTVLGTPGVGKSRLTEEFLSTVEASATVLRGRCLSYGQGITFFPMVEILAQATGADEVEAPEDVRSSILEIVGPEASAVADRLLVLTGSGEAPSATDELFWAVRSLFEALARRRPVVVVIDDIHWAEPTLLDLIEHIADWSRDAPILVLCPARPELLDARPGWGGGKMNATTILLEPLAEEECEELIGNLLGTAGLEHDVRRRIAEAAEGNPLFVEQMLAMLIDDGHLIERDGKWVAASPGDLGEVAVPPTVSALLTARLDRLSPQERRVVERGAVEGKEFHAGSVSALLDDDERAALGAHLHTLVRRELIRPYRADLPGQEGYRFRHQLIRDAAYDAIPKRTRADLHRRFAGWLASERPGDEFDEIVAYHLEHSFLLRQELGPVDEDGRRDGRRAAELLSTAGVRAVERLDYGAGQNLLRRAVALLPRPDPLRIRATIALGRSLYLLTAYQESIRVVSEARDDARALGDRPAEMLAEMERMIGLQQVSAEFSPEDHIEVGHRAVRLFEDAGEWSNAATAWEMVANGHWGMARWSLILEPLGRAIELVEREGNRGRVTSLRIRVLAAMYFGDAPVPETIEYARRLLEDAADNPVARLRSSSFLGALMGFQGEFDDGWELLDAARRISDELANGSWAAGVAFCSGALGLVSGRLELAERDVVKALGMLEGTGERGWTSTLRSELAAIQFEQGRIDEAASNAGLAREAVLEEDVSAEGSWRAITARVLSSRSEHDEAMRLMREAMEIFRTTDESNHFANGLVSFAWVADRAGLRDEAAAALREAIDVYERKGNIAGASKARDRLAALSG
jgi:tetratricopeptide (TPR) repeat protein